MIEGCNEIIQLWLILLKTENEILKVRNTTAIQEWRIQMECLRSWRGIMWVIVLKYGKLTAKKNNQTLKRRKLFKRNIKTISVF